MRKGLPCRNKRSLARKDGATMGDEGENTPITGENNPDGKGGKKGGGLDIVSTLIGAAATAAVAAVAGAIGNLFGDRSVVVTLSNNLPEPLNLITDHAD